ncbi:MAG TPA: transposase, partial [Acidimicrobiales bacterium]|nr:transposase [Acidimicrobiales bacterium]
MSRRQQAWLAITSSVAEAFVTASSVVLFCDLMSVWVLTTARRTIVQMVAVMDPATRGAHDAYHRLIRESAWSLRQSFVVLSRLVVRLAVAEGRLVLYLDDTLFHRAGPKVAGAGVWRDAVRSTKSRVVYARGLNLVVMGVRVTPPWGGMPLCLPVAFRLHVKDRPTMPELAAEMMAEIATIFPEATFVLCADGAYATLAGVGLERTTVVSRMRRDAALYGPKPERTG